MDAQLFKNLILLLAETLDLDFPFGCPMTTVDEKGQSAHVLGALARGRPNFGYSLVATMTRANSPQSVLIQAIDSLLAFGGPDLTRTLARIEASLQGVSQDKYAFVLSTCGAKAEVLNSAGLLKRVVGQINVVIHALGILLCRPTFLSPVKS